MNDNGILDKVNNPNITYNNKLAIINELHDR